MAIDALGNIFVSDANNHRIQKFDSAGIYLTECGSYGTGAGQFNFPTGVAVDILGNAYVADYFNDRTQKLAPVLWFDLEGYDSYLSVATLHETTAVRTLFRLENNGAPRFPFKNTSSDIEWSCQQRRNRFTRGPESRSGAAGKVSDTVENRAGDRTGEGGSQAEASQGALRLPSPDFLQL